jgi:ABC-type nitrate/sulfonate/bicarbonate transport system permease component
VTQAREPGALAAPQWTGAFGERAGRALLGLLGLLTLAVVLELIPRLGIISATYLPPTSEVASALVGELGRPDFWAALGNTVRTWLTGLVIALAGGIVLGVVIGAVPLLREATASTIEFLRPIPSVALIPLAVIFFSTQRGATLLLVVYASFWQVLVQVLHGVVDVDPIARETALSYRLNRFARIRYLVWPTALPYAVTGIRLAVSVALILAVTGELVIGSPGLGQRLLVAQVSNAVPTMYAIVIATGLMGVIANVLTRSAERWVLAWHPSVRREVAV